MGEREASETFGWGGADPASSATLRGPVAPIDTVHSMLPRLSVQEGPGPDGEGVSGQLFVLDLLGEGGMGQVHLARQPSLDRDVAIKRLRAGASAGSRASLLREARFMGSLEHPNIVPVHALGVDEQGGPILVMKRIEGVSFRELTHDPEHAAWAGYRGVETDHLGRCVEVLVEVCSAVAFAHQRGIVHRDLKPENVLVDAYGGVYVFDWGIAGHVGGKPDIGLAGTPAYMPPEMAVEGQRPAVTMDVYLLGACLFEVLTGQPPHPGATMDEVLEAARDGRCVALPADAPPSLAALCLRALASEPSQRPPDVPALTQGLTRWLRRRDLERTLVRCDGLRSEVEQALAVAERDYRTVADAFAAARFGYQQVLEQAPDDDGAQRGLAALLAAMVQLEVQRQDPHQSRRWLDELTVLGAADELTVAVEQLEDEAQRQRALAWEMNLDIGTRSRQLAMLTFGVLGTVGTLAVLSVDDFVFGHAEAVGFAATTLGAFLFLGVLRRHELMANIANRGLYLAVITLVGAGFLNRLVAWAFDWPIRLTLAVDLMLIANGALMLACLTRPWIGVLGVGLWLLVPLQLTWEGPPEVVFGAGTVLCFALALVVRRVLARRR